MQFSSAARRTAVLAAALALAACENGSKHASKLPDPLPSPGFQPPVTRAEQARVDLSKEAQDLQAAFDQMNAKAADPAAAGVDAPLSNTPAGSKGQGRLGDQSFKKPRSGAAKSIEDIAANKPISLPDIPIVEAPKPRKADADRTPTQKRQEAITELATQLKPGIDGAKEPLKAAMPLIGLDAISANAASNSLELVSRAVTPDQRRTVDAVRDLVRTLGTDPNLVTADSAAVSRVLRDKADQLAGSAPQDGLALGTVALCQRVDGFGRFASLGTSTFLAGRPAAMIVYSEIENFSQGRTTDSGPTRDSGEQWRVELGQTVRLYLESDGSEQLVLPESVVRDASMSKRHDFFLVQRVDLPRNLTVGNYKLKVTVRDIASGALAERALPLRVVADASALAERDTGPSPVKLGGSGTSDRFAGAGSNR